MELQFYGANCVRISTKKATVTVDDNLETLGVKSPSKEGDICLFTSDIVKGKPKAPKIVIDQPGEYEVSNVSVQGIAARAHMDEEGKQTATIYKITLDDTKIAVVGHIYPELNDDQLEALGMIDVLIVPVGGSGYTMDGTGALKVTKKIEPKVVIPTHYDDKDLKFEVPQLTLTEALKQMSMEPTETTAKFKVKHSELPENMQLVVLEKQ